MRRFKTKKEEYEYYNNIRKSYEEGEKLLPYDELIVLGILEKHPNYDEIIGKGLSYIKVDKDAFKSKCFYAVDVEGNEVSFSPRRAIDGSRTSREKFIRAARAEIVDDIQEIKNRHLSKYLDGDKTLSALSGEWFNVEEAHIDHYKPYFKEIVEEFMKWIDVHKVKYIKRNGNIPLFQDRNLAQAWRDYHKDVAVLRVISAKENLTRGMNDDRESIIPNLKIEW